MLFMAIDAVKFRKAVTPGDQLIIEVVPLRKGKIFKMKGEIRVRRQGRVVGGVPRGARREVQGHVMRRAPACGSCSSLALVGCRVRQQLDARRRRTGDAAPVEIVTEPQLARRRRGRGDDRRDRAERRRGRRDALALGGTVRGKHRARDRRRLLPARGRHSRRAAGRAHAAIDGFDLALELEDASGTVIAKLGSRRRAHQARASRTSASRRGATRVVVRQRRRSRAEAGQAREGQAAGAARAAGSGRRGPSPVYELTAQLVPPSRPAPSASPTTIAAPRTT